MDLLTKIIALVLVLLAIELAFTTAWFGRIARGLEWVRFRCGRRIPVGSYRFTGDIRIDFGVDDTTLILGVTIPGPDMGRPTRCIAVTDASTRFTVNGHDASPDALLESYDDSLGPIFMEVHEPGRITHLGIAGDARLTSRSDRYTPPA